MAGVGVVGTGPEGGGQVTWVKRSPVPMEEQWSAFCGICRRIVAEGSEVDVKRSWTVHRSLEHPMEEVQSRG